ncbi:hypothetical protein PF010_g32771, partial [Phytophthora fragariae]
SGMTGELSGDLKKVIPTAMRVEMGKFNASLHTSANDGADADTLYKETEALLMHVCTISSTYMEKYRTDLASTIKAEFAGDDKRVHCFCASKNVYGLSAWVVWYYCPIARIRIVYIRSYRQELLRRIQGVVSGENC